MKRTSGKSPPPTGIRRSSSSQETSRRTQTNQRVPATSQQNATWDSRGSAVLSSAATQVLFQENRRGSNGVIPGQLLPEFPPPSLRPHGDSPPEVEDQFNSSLSRMHKGIGAARRNRSRIYDDPAVVAGYNSVPLLDLDQLPRGGISIETKAVGRIQVSHRKLWTCVECVCAYVCGCVCRQLSCTNSNNQQCHLCVCSCG